jgi:uncharacterized protein (DUF58 family)
VTHAPGARLGRLVQLRPIVYAVGLVLGALAVATARREVFWLMAVVLLTPAMAALVTRAARPRRARLTAEGRIAMIFAVGFLAAALNTGTNLLYLLLAVLVALLAVSLIASSIVFRSLYVRRRVPARVRALEPFEAEVTVRNDKGIPAFAIAVEEARPGLLAPPVRARTFFPQLGGRKTARGAWTTAFARRGEHTLDGVALETRFPAGLVARRIEIALPQTVLVLPATFRVKNEVFQARAVSADAIARRPLVTEERRDVVRALRDYRSGDHPRAIHWRASAHRGSLVVKDFEKTEPQRVLLVLDVWGNEPVLEDAVSLAASLATGFRERGMKVGLAARMPDPRVVGPDQASTARLHAALARLVAPGDPDLSSLVPHARRVSDRARVVLVTTRPEAAARDALSGLSIDLVLSLEKPGDVARYRESA